MSTQTSTTATSTAPVPETAVVPAPEIPAAERQAKAIHTVRNYMWWTMGAGLIPIPFVDLVAVSGVQYKMVADIAKMYEIRMEDTRIKAIVGALLGFIVPSQLNCGVVGSALKAIPGVGAIAGAPALALFAGAATWALGKVFIQHFESGGTFLDFDPNSVKEYFLKQFNEGKVKAQQPGPAH